MANMLDYLGWRGDIGLETSPWCPVDALLFATLSYLDFHGIDTPEGWTMREAKRIDLAIEGKSDRHWHRKQMFDAMADSVRFGEARMHHMIVLTDEEKEMQFSALCVDVPDGSMCIAFRGTDNTIVGWKEDFNMAYQNQVPAQEAATYYLYRAAESTDRPVRLVGHSKGGNLAMYAAANVDEQTRQRVESIWSFDGPGMNDEVFATAGYAAIRDRIHAYVPQGSIIGLLMNYPRPYTVVRSTASGLTQHDPMTWQVYGPDFEKLEAVDASASLIQETLHDWLRNSTPEQRGIFVEAMFRYVDSTGATRMSDLTGEKLRSLRQMMSNRKEVDPASRKEFTRQLAQAVAMGFGNAVEMVRSRKEGEEVSLPVGAAQAITQGISSVVEKVRTWRDNEEKQASEAKTEADTAAPDPQIGDADERESDASGTLPVEETAPGEARETGLPPDQN